MSRTQDKDKTKEQLKKELTELRQQIVELEQSKNERKKMIEGGSEEELRAIIDCAQDGIVLLDLTGKVTAMNKSITETAGYTEKDIIGKRLTRLKMFPPKSIATMFTAFTHVISGQQPPPYEVEAYTKTGKKLVVEIHASLLMKGGEKAGVVAVLRDITERKKLESLLLQERETFITILQHALYGVVLLDRDGKHVYVNPAFTAIMGYTLEDIPTMSEWLHKAYPDKAYRQKVTALWKDDRRVGVTQRVISVVCKNGETKEIEFRPTMLEDGRAVVMLADVTERKQAEEALEQKIRELETFVNNIPHMAWLKDVDSNFILANQAFGNAVGMDPEYLRNHTRAVCFGEEAAKKFKDDDRKVMEGKKQVTIKETIVDDKGNQIFLETRKSPIFNEVGDVIGTVGIATDITEHKRAEEALQKHREHLEELVTERTAALQATNAQLQWEITERKQMEEALRESEGKYRSLVESSDDSIYLVDRNCNYIFLNNRHLARLGVRSSQAIGRAYGEFHSPEESKDFAQRIKKVLKSGQSLSYEYRSQRDNRYFIRTLNPVTSPDGGVINTITVISKDITERKHAEEKLRESEERFRAIFETAQDFIFLKDKDSKFTAVNPAMERLYGVSASKLIGKTGAAIFGKEMAARVREQDVRVLSGEIIDEEYSSPLKGNTAIHHIIKVPIHKSAGEIIGLCGIGRDITDRKQIEQALRESQQELQTLMDASPAAISWADLQGKIQYINRKHHELFGYTLEDIPTIDEWRRQADQSPAQEERFAHWGEELMEAHLQGRSLPPREMTVTCKDGSIRYVTVEGTVVSNHNLVIYNDITERVRAEETIRKLAYHDALTGLPNRVLFADRLDLAMSQAHRSQRRLAVMLLDLDRFKNVNDTFGHNVGDTLLHSVGKRLTGMLRKNDTISRTGGDEFSLLMPEIDQEKDTVTVAQKVLDIFQEPFVLDVHEIHITTSIGIAIYPDDGEDADTLLKHSDIAMYQAKQKGRNNYQRYTPI